jgi:hypothetical protein
MALSRNAKLRATDLIQAARRHVGMQVPTFALRHNFAPVSFAHSGPPPPSPFLLFFSLNSILFLFNNFSLLPSVHLVSHFTCSLSVQHVRQVAPTVRRVVVCSYFCTRPFGSAFRSVISSLFAMHTTSKNNTCNCI